MAEDNKIIECFKNKIENMASRIDQIYILIEKCSETEL